MMSSGDVEDLTELLAAVNDDGGDDDDEVEDADDRGTDAEDDRGGADFGAKVQKMGVRTGEGEFIFILEYNSLCLYTILRK